VANEEKYRAPITYDGIGPFPITQWDESGFMMDWSEYRFPHRRYKDAEPLSVAPLLMNGDSPFLNGIEGYEDLWPFKFMQMRRRCQLPRGGNLRHPLYGNVWGHFTRWDPKYTAQTLNGCTVNWTFSQDIDPAATQQLDLVERNPLAGAKANAAKIDAAVSQLAMPPVARKTGADFPIPADVIATIAQVDSLVGSIQPPAPITLPIVPSPNILKVAGQVPFSALIDSFDLFLRDARSNYDEIQAEADKIEARFKELEESPELLLPENADLFIAQQAARADVAQTALEAQEQAARIVSFILDRTCSPLELAMLLYEDPFRAQELVELNPLDGCEYPAGVEIRFLDR